MILSETVTIVTRPTGTGSGTYGPVYDWASATRTVVPAEVRPEQLGDYETNTGMQLVEALWRITLWPSAVITAVDRVEWRGRTYEVHGQIEEWPHRGRLHSIQAKLKRVERA